jgi:hypothetical protein
VLLSLAISRGWVIRQIDIQNVFLHGFLNEDVYMKQPAGFVDSEHPTISANWINLCMASSKPCVPGFLA